MARRLDKIEKERGYCDIKLEKERRLRRQVEYVQAQLSALDSLLEILARFADSLPPGVETARAPQDGSSGGTPTREAFYSVGLEQLTLEKKTLYERERDDLSRKLEHYVGFEEKKARLRQEKNALLAALSPARRAQIELINAEFKEVEREWNELAEDLTNIDDAIFYLGRNLDYLKSCRNFMIVAKGNIDLEAGNPFGTLVDLFRHSTIGRAVEMADGADRNLCMAHKELICLGGAHFELEKYSGVLEAFLQALHEDLFEERRIHRSIQVIEAALTAQLEFFEEAKALRAVNSERLEQAEQKRNQVFSKLGSGKKTAEAVIA